MVQIFSNLSYLMHGADLLEILFTFPFVCLTTPKLTAWSRVILEKLIIAQIIKKFPAFYGTRRIITVFTRARHLSLI
jgi:hypothetical protein